MENYYRILQVSPNAAPGLIHDAYRSLSRRYRPDVNSSPVATNLLRQINEAYEVLKDPKRRHEYDLEFARQGMADSSDAFCDECRTLAKQMFSSSAPPCEWCDRYAVLCAPRPDQPEGDSAFHIWLCQQCLNDTFASL